MALSRVWALVELEAMALAVDALPALWQEAWVFMNGGRGMREEWLVMSCYQDGERVVERLCADRESADEAVQDVRRFREDQDELPHVVVGRVSWAVE